MGAPKRMRLDQDRTPIYASHHGRLTQACQRRAAPLSAQVSGEWGSARYMKLWVFLRRQPGKTVGTVIGGRAEGAGQKGSTTNEYRPFHARHRQPVCVDGSGAGQACGLEPGGQPDRIDRVDAWPVV